MSPIAPPAEASSIAGQVDALFLALLGLSALVIGGVTVALVYLAVRYRRGSGAPRRRISGQWRWELAWTLIPFGLFLGLFAWSARLYLDLYSPPDDAMPIYVVGKQWMWKIQHLSGRREINALHIPVGRPVKLVMTSQDVIHSFYVPAFRIKQDVVPGRYTRLWFEATRPGEYPLYCAEYCGTDHAAMKGKVVAMKPAAYSKWRAAHPAPTGLAAEGERHFHEYGCSGCHAAGSSVHAPPLQGVFGRPVQLAGGGSVVADEAYIRDSILLPRKQVVAGYDPIMPSFDKQIDESELIALIAYVRSLGQEETPP